MVGIARGKPNTRRGRLKKGINSRTGSSVGSSIMNYSRSSTSAGVSELSSIGQSGQISLIEVLVEALCATFGMLPDVLNAITLFGREIYFYSY